MVDVNDSPVGVRTFFAFAYRYAPIFAYPLRTLLRTLRGTQKGTQKNRQALIHNAYRIFEW